MHHTKQQDGPSIPPQIIKDKHIQMIIEEYELEQQQSTQEEEELKKIQNLTGRRTLQAAIIIITSYLYCLIFKDQSEIPSKWLANYIPIIKKLRTGTEIGMLPANYFSISIFLIPILGTRMAWGVDFLITLKYAANTHRVSPKTLFCFFLFCGVPFITFIANSIYQSDLPIRTNTSQRCGNCPYWMINSHAGLLILGSALILQFIMFWGMLIIILWTPILAIKKYLAKGN